MSTKEVWSIHTHIQKLYNNDDNDCEYMIAFQCMSRTVRNNRFVFRSRGSLKLSHFNTELFVSAFPNKMRTEVRRAHSCDPIINIQDKLLELTAPRLESRIERNNAV